MSDAPDDRQPGDARLVAPGPGVASEWPVGVESFHLDQYEHMVRVSTLIVGSVSVAEEVVQDVFIELAQRWEAVDEPAACLRTSVVNRSKTALRRAARERPQQRVRDVIAPEGAPGLESMQPLWQAIERLSPRRRAAAVLRFYEGLDTDEIAEVLKCRRATVRSLIHRATRQLERRLS